MAQTVIACVNLKGGVGKTALAVNLAAIAGERHNLRTLLVDLDPQTNATFSCISADDWKQHARSKGTIADLFGLKAHTSAQNTAKGFTDVVKQGVFKNVDLLPSHLDLFTMDLDLGGKAARERLLERALKPHRDSYDLIVCDCPPNLTLPTQNALAITTHYVVPVSLDYLSSLGISLLLNRVGELAQDLDTKIECAGIVLSRVGRQSFHRMETRDTLEAQFKKQLIPHEIKERSCVDEAASKQKPVHQYQPNSEAAVEFCNVAHTLLRNAGAIK